MAKFCKLESYCIITFILKSLIVSNRGQLMPILFGYIVLFYAQTDFF